jgi:cell division protein FtsB
MTETPAETTEQLHAKIDQLKMENDFLESGLERIHARARHQHGQTRQEI